MSAEVMPGYKQTEVGVIPEDWETKGIGEISTTVASGKSRVNTKYGDYPVYGSTGIIGRCLKGDYSGRAVLAARVGANAGKLAVVSGEYGVTDNTIIIRINDSCDLAYFWRQLEAKRLNSMIFGSGQPLITGSLIKSLFLPFPPTKLEQQRIAEALSDADALIEGLGQLISKKLEVKQGAMQKLFSPRDEWVQTELGELCSPSKERFDPLASDKKRKCVELEHISSETGRLLGYFSTNGLRSQKAVFRQGDVLFGKLRPYLRKYWFASFDGVCSTELWVLRAFPKVHSGWLYWLVQTDQVVDAANKSTGTKMPRAEWGTVKETEVYLPSPEEQTEIATILSDMDAEIAGLETKLDKARRVKEGMIQDLLTGKVRLV